MPQIHHHQYVVSKRQFVVGLIISAVILGSLYLVFFLLPRIFAEVTYPIAYEDIIVEEARAHDLDPVLVAAVIYTESRFSSQATSPVGARGLMQLMPLTAAGIARRIGDTGFTPDKLYDPRTNIRYGTYHLQGLFGRYNSDVEPALVAYNGGGGAGDRYQAGQRASVPLESLGYVKKVLSARDAYQELYSYRLGGVDPFARTDESETPATRILNAIAQTISARLGI